MDGKLYSFDEVAASLEQVISIYKRILDDDNVSLDDKFQAAKALGRAQGTRVCLHMIGYMEDERIAINKESVSAMLSWFASEANPNDISESLLTELNRKIMN